MSDLSVSALDGARFDGIVSVREMGLQGMVSLKADLAQDRTAAAIKGATGADMPAPRGMVPTDDGLIAWMAPDELLILCPHAQADALVETLDEKLHDRHHLAANVSDARVMFELQGAAIRDVLAKLTPADLRPSILEPGEMRRSRLSQVPAAFWLVDDSTLRLIAFRSVARYVFDILAMSAKPGGEVGFHQR